MNDYRVVAKIKNNRILERIEARGFKTVVAFCTAMKLSYHGVSNLICMSDPARLKNNNWRPLAETLASALGCNVEDLFTDLQAKAGVRQRTVTRLFNEDALVSLDIPDAAKLIDLSAKDVDEAIDEKTLLQKLLRGLTARQERVIRLRHGLSPNGEMTLGEVAQEFGLSIDRIRQIEAKALRIMKRHAARLCEKAKDKRIQVSGNLRNELHAALQAKHEQELARLREKAAKERAETLEMMAPLIEVIELASGNGMDAKQIADTLVSSGLVAGRRNWLWAVQTVLSPKYMRTHDAPSLVQ